MAQSLALKINGLYTAANPFSGAPDGALLQADDVNVDQTNLGTPRRGFNAHSTLPSGADRLNRIEYYQGVPDVAGHLVAHFGASSVGYYNGSSWTSYGTGYNHPDPILARCRFFKANKNLYFTTSNGVYKLDSVESNTPKSAGVPQGLDVQLALTGSSGFMTSHYDTGGTFIGSTTNTSTTLTVPGTLTLPSTSISGANTYVSGTGIPVGTTITGTTQPTQAASTTVASTTAGATTITVGSATGIANGQVVTDLGGTVFQTGTTVTNVSGTTITLSLPVKTTSASQIGVTFTTPGSFTLSQAATATNTSVTVSYGYGSQVAYRIFWGIVDANSNTILGAPSQWVSIQNTTGQTGGTNVQVTSTIPSGITTAHFFRAYRSAQTATDGVTPSDELQLVYQGNPSSSDISNGYVQFTDSTPDSLRGDTAPTSPSQGGVSKNSYLPPPNCKDACLFNGILLYANVSQKQSLSLNVLGVGSPNGVQVGDTLTIGGVTYTAGNANNVGTLTFKVDTSSASPAINLTNTVNNLIQVVNRSSSSVVYAFLLSGPADLPGKLQLQARTYSQAAFSVTASAHGTAYSPSLPTSGSTVTSTNVAYRNGVMASVQNQPESVPGANLLPLVGAASEDILRVIPLRDWVCVLKTDGVFRIVGNTLDNLQVLGFDPTTFIVAPDTAVALNNRVYALTNQGVVSISDTGVEQVSWTNINDVITSLFGTAFSAVQQYATGIAYQTDHAYLLCLPSSNGPNTQVYRLNIFTNAWTRWGRSQQCGFVHPTENKLYLGNVSSNQIVVERKTGTYQDYIDELAATPNITASSGTSVTLSSLTNVNVGDLLYQNSSHASVITSVNLNTMTVSVRDLVAWTNGAASVFPSIKSVMRWKALTAANPGFLKQFQEGDLLFGVTRFSNATLSFYTDVDQSSESIPLSNYSNGSWGRFKWGRIPWGDINRPQPVRFLIPLNKQGGGQLSLSFTCSTAWSNWALTGVNIVYQDISQELDG